MSVEIFTVLCVDKPPDGYFTMTFLGNMFSEYKDEFCFKSVSQATFVCRHLSDPDKHSARYKGVRKMGTDFLMKILSTMAFI